MISEIYLKALTGCEFKSRILFFEDMREIKGDKLCT